MKIMAMSFGILALGLLVSCATRGTPIADYQNPHKALLILDMQKDFVGANARMSIDENSKVPLIQAINNVAALAAKNGILVIYIRNEFPASDVGNLFRNNAAVKGTPGSEIDPRVVLVSDVVFDKDQPDAFSNPQLGDYLVSQQVNEVTVTGVFADQCCYFTSLGALNRRYKVNYLTDAVGATSASNIQNAAQSLHKQGVNTMAIDHWRLE